MECRMSNRVPGMRKLIHDSLRMVLFAVASGEILHGGTNELLQCLSWHDRQLSVPLTGLQMVCSSLSTG